jgi:hypothetical protein
VRSVTSDAGLAGLVAARTGGLMTAYQAARAGLIDSVYTQGSRFKV